jgi:hypothetical protein
VAPEVKSETYSVGWLEAALTDNLRPVGAPAELWDRVEMPRMTGAGRFSGSTMLWRLALTSAAAAMLVVGLWTFGRASFRNQELRSSDPAAISAWVKDRCGFALPLSAEASPEIRLSAVRFQTRGPSAEVAFRVEDRPALLQIAQVNSARLRESAHHRLAGDARSVSWVAEGRLFTLACATPEDLRIACSLCHAGGVL